MKARQFLHETFDHLDQTSIDLAKRMLLDTYVKLSFIGGEDVTEGVLAEKLYDFFEEVCLANYKSFENCLANYMEALVALVEPHIAREDEAAEDEDRSAGIPRARRYFDRYQQYRSNKDLTYPDLMDYSRVMLCLYQSLIKAGTETISNFDLDADSLDPAAIIGAMEAEERHTLLPPFVVKRFDTSEPYAMDTCIIVLTILMLCTVVTPVARG